METLDYIKILLLGGLFFGFAPLFGLFMRLRPKWQRATFFMMCFLTLSGFFEAAEWGLTVHSILYRGTARGFHFYWAELAAVSLIWAQMSGDWTRFRFAPPGFWLYIIYCFASLISFINAPAPLQASFAAFKAFKAVVIFIAAFNFIKSENDLKFALRCMGWVMMWELIAVLRQKYLLHVYQVWGTFEHQNSLCMFSILIGLVFLSVAMGPKDKHSNFFLFSYLVCAAIVQSSLSRGGLVMFAVGTIGVILASLVDKPTRRRLYVLAGISCIALLGLMMTMDTIVGRFEDYGNEESKNTRHMLNISASMMLHDYPLGIGWNNFAETINKPYPYGDHIDHWQLVNGNTVDPDYKKGVVESLWWLLLSETGYQGFITYLALIVTFLWWNLKNAIFFRRHYLGAVSIGLFMGSFMNYMQSFLERVLTQPRNMFLWFMLLAATARIWTWRKAEIKRRFHARQEARARANERARNRRKSERPEEAVA
ncbi:MAG: O-antigen ligase family protein [Verrucomicrobiota bacterium]